MPSTKEQKKVQKTFKELLTERLYEAFLRAFPKEVTLLPKSSITASVPEAKHGDWATNLPLQLAGLSKQPPMQVAEKLANHFAWPGIVEQTTLAKPGFLNLTLTNAFRQRRIVEYHRSSEALFFPPSSMKGENILLEFVSANPTGPLHIGHGRWAAIGNALANIFEKMKCHVHREFYVNDHGNQIAKFLASVEAVRKGKPIPEDGYHGDYIEAFQKNNDPPVEAILSDQRQLLSELGVRFDRYFRESELHEKDKTTQTNAIDRTLARLQEQGITYKEEGALWLRSSSMGDDKDRVLVKANDELTYFAVDIAYHFAKIRRGFGRLINVFGADHHGYVNRLQAAVKLLSKNNTSLDIIIGQLVQITKEGEPTKMSKRQGNMVSLREVVVDIGKDATLYYLTMRSASSPLEFDLEQAKAQNNDNPLYYVQYAHARIGSVLRNAKNKGFAEADLGNFDYNQIEHPDLNVLANCLVQFPDELQLICQSYATHHLNAFLYRTAAAFHKAYANIPFVSEGANSKTKHYMVFLKALQNLFKQGLSLIGVSAPEHM